jgi:hypothetical protein
MRSFKKALTMALVFVMAIGLLTAGALDFTDANDIQYKEAVEVMTGIGAINGYTDGTFRPDGLLTRAEAAKLVTYAILTERVAQYLPSGSSSFTDVATNHWAVPYIEYCVSKGIINGRGNGIFDPNGNVTAFEIAKMLLTAAGYGQNGEYVGASWSLNVVADAIDNDIFVGSKATNYGAPATREEAALYVFNGLTKVNRVEYSKDTDSYKDLTSDKTIGEWKYGLNDVASTVNGVSGYTWMSKSGPVSSFIVAENVLGTSMNGTAISELTKKYGASFIAEEDDTVDYFYNGFGATAYAVNTDYAKDDLIVEDGKVYEVTADIAKAANTKFSDVATTLIVDPATKGVIVNLVDGNGNGKADKIAITNKAVAQLSADPVVKNDTVDIAGITSTAVDVKYVPGYDTLAEDDVVLWYLDASGVYNIEKAETTTGTVTAIRGSKYYIDGVVFELSGLTGATGTPALGNATDTYFLDNGGYIVFKSGPTAPQVDDTYALVIDYNYEPADTWAGVAASSKAKLLLEDGTVGIYDLVTNSGKVANDALAKGSLIKYVMDDDDVITSVVKEDNVNIIGLTAATTTKGGNTTTIGGTTYYNSASTVFFFYEDNAGVIENYGVTVGYKTVQAVTGTTDGAYVADANKVLKVMSVNVKAEAAVSDKVYAYITNATPLETLKDGKTVYSYDAFINGEAVTVTEGTKTVAAAGLYEAVEAKGLYTLTSKSFTVSGKDVTIAESTYFVADSTLYNITNTTQAYKATITGGAVTKLEAADFALVAGKTLKADILADGSSNALFVVFWYE